MSALKNKHLITIFFLRMCISGLFAILILNLLIAFYYMLPLHINNPQETTDYIWQPNSFWIKMTEGIAWGKMDELGFNNQQVIKNPEVLILGSSHMEATNVCQDENTASLLQNEFENRGLAFKVYNHGISGHHFLKCCKYLSNNMQSDSLKYVIIETSNVGFSQTEIEDLLSGKIDFTTSYTKGILAFLQKLPFFRELYFQIDHGLLDLFLPKKPIHINSTAQDNSDLVPASYEKLFSFVKENSNDKPIVIFFHPTGNPDVNGNLVFNTDEFALSLFSETAKEYGIDFIDLTAQTEKLWHTEHKTTHGFCTGTAFSGHLNKNGHKIAAQAIADMILSHQENIRDEN